MQPPMKFVLAHAEPALANLDFARAPFNRSFEKDRHSCFGLVCLVLVLCVHCRLPVLSGVGMPQERFRSIRNSLVRLLKRRCRHGSLGSHPTIFSRKSSSAIRSGSTERS